VFLGVKVLCSNTIFRSDPGF